MPAQGGQVKEDYESFLASVETDAVIAAWYLDLWPMVYLQTVENMRPDVTIVDRFRITREDESALMELSLTGRPVYVFGWVPYMNFPHEAIPVWQSNQDLPQGCHDVAQRIVSLPASAPRPLYNDNPPSRKGDDDRLHPTAARRSIIRTLPSWTASMGKITGS